MCSTSMLASVIIFLSVFLSLVEAENVSSFHVTHLHYNNADAVVEGGCAGMTLGERHDTAQFSKSLPLSRGAERSTANYSRGGMDPSVSARVCRGPEEFRGGR